MEIALIFYCSTLNVKKQVSYKLLIHLIISSYDEGITNYIHRLQFLKLTIQKHGSLNFLNSLPSK
jgi:hypothetical protein